MKYRPTTYHVTLGSLFVLFAIINALFLHRMPGLMGDEASEGQNVFELLEREGITITGERSYIGPLIDYIRVPFIKTFGYTALAVRVPMYLFSLLTFALAASVFRKWFGENLSLFPLVAAIFSLLYLTQQRLGWAIVLFPFFFFLTVWLVQRQWVHKWVFVGLAAGLGLHTHIMFAPTLAALIVTGPVAAMHPHTVLAKLRALWGAPSGATRSISMLLSLLVGFWAAFGTQFVVLQLNTEDQGDPTAVGEVISERIAALPSLLPVVISGSSYVARYTGVEFSLLVSLIITWIIVALALIGVVLGWRRKITWLWLLGLAVHLSVLLYMIDRFTLRYFVMFVLGVYVLAGLGVGEIVIRLGQLLPRYTWYIPAKVLGLAGILSLLWVWLVLLPFLRTGGSVADFSLGNRTDSAAALVDTRPLLECLRGAGSARPVSGGVSSENVHIYNRLLYLSHEYSDLRVVPEEDAKSAEFLVHYRLPTISVEQELCPSLAHFIVARNR